MRIASIVFILFFIAITNMVGQSHIWQRSNPGGGGAFNLVKAGPTGTILVASDLSGVYMSTDQGNSFKPLGALQGITQGHIGGLGFDPTNADKFFIGAVDGLFRTVDHGNSFTQVIATGYVSDIIVCPSNTNIVYAAWHADYTTVDGQIYKSTDGGATFAKVSNIPSSNQVRILKLIGHPTNANKLYLVSGAARAACGAAKIYRSDNGGVAFTNISNGSEKTLDLAIDPSNPTTLYMTSMNADCSAPYYYTDREGEFYQSTNEGASWTLKSNETGAIFIKNDVPSKIRRIDPRNTASWNTESGTWQSTDNGSTWTQTGFVTNWDGAYLSDVAGPGSNEDITWAYGTSFEGLVKGMGTDMSNPDGILWATTQYVFRSIDGGVTFQNIFTDLQENQHWKSSGLDNINIMDVEINPANPNIIYAGFFDIGFWRSLDGGKSWSSSNPVAYSGGWQGYGGNVASIVADPTRANILWSTQSGSQIGDGTTYLLKNTNFGDRNNWTLSNTGLPTTEVMGLSIDKNSPATNRKLFVTADGFLYRSNNDGANWTAVTSGLPVNGGLRFTAVDNFNSSIVYAGGGNGLYGSTNGGTSWTLIGSSEINTGGNIEFWPQWNGQGVFDIKPDPLISGTVYVTVYGTGKGLYKGVKNTGSTWTWTKLYTDSYMRKVAVHPTQTSTIYATSSSAFTDGYYHPNSKGIIYSTDGFATSQIVNQGMAWPFAMTVDISPDEVYVGCPGTGIQKSRLTSINAETSWLGYNNEWHRAYNWSSGQTPDQHSIAIIKNNVPFQPIVTLPVNQCKELRLETNAKITIATGAKLEVGKE
jgi:hypothetical protein